MRKPNVDKSLAKVRKSYPQHPTFSRYSNVWGVRKALSRVICLQKINLYI